MRTLASHQYSLPVGVQGSLPLSSGKRQISIDFMATGLQDLLCEFIEDSNGGKIKRQIFLRVDSPTDVKEIEQLCQKVSPPTFNCFSTTSNMLAWCFILEASKLLRGI
jgi:hypothetical protein